jgi:pimeloyl-ACP methyl ester carboxylesterase
MDSMELARASRARGIRRQLEVNGCKVVYFEYPTPKADARTLVMIHGYRGNHHGLEPIAAGLSQYRVLIPDLPGFGESAPLASEHSIENYALWLSAFLSEISLSQDVNLMGHSFGTLIVGHYATKTKVRSISLINPVSAPALRGPRAGLTWLTKIYYKIASVLPNAVGQLILRSRVAVMVMSVVMSKTPDKSLRRWIHAQHLANFSDFASLQVAVEGYNASISTDLSQLASGIESAVLVVAAELDDITDLATQQSVVATYPNAILREIPAVGHLVHYEAPEAAASFISEFLESIP